ncbi:CPBP family glutamic-type intramembrane protease, partial [Bacillus mycoides]|uniref:CPBP family glutamic-type intramembrane protease n=1 Tax=Bacillus mycoides TaxID=1405 RepID=UPI0011A37745
FAEIVGANIEIGVLGINGGCEKREKLMEIARATPSFLILVSIIRPILQDIVFTKILFPTLYKTFNFFIPPIITSLLFPPIHFHFTHFLLYTSIPLLFPFLYLKTKP